MSEEKEIKARILDDLSIDEIKRAIESEFSVRFGDCRQDHDTYHDLKDDFYFNRNQGLRIRNNEELAYKALFFIPEREPNHWFVYEKEHRLPISRQDLISIFDFADINHDLEMPDLIGIEELKAILKGLGFTEKIKIKKTRWSATNKDHKICVDSVERLGSFVEIEVKDDRFFETFRKRLPFRYEEIRHGYTELYAKEVLKIKAPDFKAKFLSNPDWNYLDGQKQQIISIIKGQKTI
ncbi:MAG: CYTH domain-containing protein [Nanoarchaeota archaeon]